MVQLSICLPTRNRQTYCIETIKALAAHEDRDFEVIVADNSDDPAPLAEYLGQTLKDDRFRLIPPAPSVLPMVDNWERAVEESKGRWITVIGDDDYVDPRLAELTRRFEVKYRDADAISWERMTFQWPDNRPVPTLARIPLGSGVNILSKQALSDQLYRWSEGKRRPGVGVGIYHGAIKRSLMERIRQSFGGRYFEHPNVDWESTCKVVAAAKAIVHTQRPFSVLGACAASNSAATVSRETMGTKLATFEKETQGGISLNQPSFPFRLTGAGASLCLSIATTTAWFCHTYRVDLTGFGTNFAHAAMDECRYSHTREEYDAKVDCFASGFAEWEGGKWAAMFKPPAFSPPKTINQLSGVSDETLNVREAELGPATPEEFYRFGEHVIMPVDNLLAGTKVFAL
jgi:hypothetical protein